ncbi:MAG: hypothetical protein K8F25_15610 [Fimbriimonadaceae bacterium]|nr:hypothetical protein [Alphaproteobacteria bacterium]
MRCNIFSGSLIAILLALNPYPTISSVSAQTNSPSAMPGGMAGMPSLQQEELTIDIAKAGIDSFLELKEKYGGDQLPDLDSSSEIGVPEALLQYAGFQNIVKSYGFDDVSQWHRVVLSLLLAHNFTREGQMEEYEQSIEEMKQANLPEETQQQMIAMMTVLKPSDNNIAVAQTLRADAEYALKFEKMQD